MATKKKKAVKKKAVKKKAVKKKAGKKPAVKKKKAKTSTAKKKKASTAKKKSVKKAVKKTAAKKKAKTATKKTAKKAAPKKPARKVGTARKSASPRPQPKKKPAPPQVEEEIMPVIKPAFKKDDPRLEKVRAMLIQDRTRMLGMLRSSQEVERTINDITFSNEIDLASSLEGREMAFQLSSRERNELRLIENAIFKISAGTYGVCENCGKAIGIKRLEIMPLTALCIECQENMEVR